MVDQAHELRRTHGVQACAAMLAKLEHALASGLRPTEQLGRWGEDEFLLLSHERTPEDAGGACAKAGRTGQDGGFPLVGRPPFNPVSMGAAQAKTESSLAELLESARERCCGVSMRGEIRSPPLRGADMFAIVGILIVFVQSSGLSHGEGAHRGASSASRVADHRGRGHWHPVGGQSRACVEGHRGRAHGRAERVEVGKDRYLSTLKMMYQFLNKVRKEGLLSVENDVEKPRQAPFSRTIRTFWETIMRATLSATRCAWPSPGAWNRSTWTR